MTNREKRLPKEAPPETLTKASVDRVSAGTDMAQEARRRAHAYAVVVHNGDRWNRRIYLSLRSATQAVDRARDRGAAPFLELVELIPAGE